MDCKVLAVRDLLPWERALWRLTYGTYVFEYAFKFLYSRQEARRVH